LAAEVLGGTPDGDGFQRLLSWYRAALASESASRASGRGVYA
jgi:hypothetical protein